MALFSAGARYGLQACLLLAGEEGRAALPGAVIAQRLRIPPQYLPVVLLRLKSAGVVATVRGQRGGYRLARAPSAIRVLEVLQAIDGPDHLAAEDGRHGELVDRVLAAAGRALREALALSLAQALERYGIESAPMFHI